MKRGMPCSAPPFIRNPHDCDVSLRLNWAWMKDILYEIHQIWILLSTNNHRWRDNIYTGAVRAAVGFCLQK